MSILFPYTLTSSLGALQWPKVDAIGIPQGAQRNQYLSSSDWNVSMEALVELALGITSGTLFGFQRQAVSPTGSAGGTDTDFIYLNSSGQIIQHKKDGTESTIGGGGTLSSSYVGALSAADNTLLLDRSRGGLQLKVNVPAFAAFPFQVISGTQNLLSVDSTGNLRVPNLITAAGMFVSPGVGIDVSPGGSFPFGASATTITLGSTGGTVVPFASASLTLGSTSLPWKNVTGITGSLQVLDTPTTNQVLRIGNTNASSVQFQYSGSPQADYIAAIDSAFGILAFRFHNATGVVWNSNSDGHRYDAGTIGSYIGGSQLAIFDTTHFYPTTSGTFALGSGTNPFGNVFSITGSFQVLDTPTTNQNLVVGGPKSAAVVFVVGGAGKYIVDANGVLYPNNSGSQNLGLTANPFKNVTGISGSFQVIDAPQAGQTLFFGNGNAVGVEAKGTTYARIVSPGGNGWVRADDTVGSQIYYAGNEIAVDSTNITFVIASAGAVIPTFSGTMSFGTAAKPWKNVVSITGSFQRSGGTSQNVPWTQQFRIDPASGSLVHVGVVSDHTTGSVVNNGLPGEELTVILQKDSTANPLNFLLSGSITNGVVVRGAGSNTISGVSGSLFVLKLIYDDRLGAWVREVGVSVTT